MRRTAEAVVIGGGVMGCSILYNLAARGVTDTVLLEQNELASGSTIRSQAILRMHYSNEVTAQLAWQSLPIFREFEQMTGSPSGYVRTGYFLAVDEDDRDALVGNVTMHQRLGIRADVVSPDEARRISPLLATEEDETFAYEPESGYADPYLLTTGYANRARDMGAAVSTGTTVTGVETDGGRVTGVTTAGGTISTPLAVVAAGPWSKPLLDRIGVDVPLGTVRHQLVMVERPDDTADGHPIVGDIVNDLSTRPGCRQHHARRGWGGRVCGAGRVQPGRRHGDGGERDGGTREAHPRHRRRAIPRRLVRPVHHHARLAPGTRPGRGH